jgi:3-hydroxypropanoate dehydrogenase
MTLATIAPDVKSTSSLSGDGLDLIFRKARTFDAWQNRSAPDDLLQRVYDLAKMGPTSANMSPARFLFIVSKQAKARLKPALAAGNVVKTMAAPVTVIIAQDLEFYDKLPKLYPHVDAKAWFVGKPEFIQESAFRNSTLQGAYFMMAARALGLDCGPMSGFDNKKVDEEFLKGTSWHSNFLCNLGFGEPATLHPRSPRLDFKEACRIL